VTPQLKVNAVRVKWNGKPKWICAGTYRTLVAYAENIGKSRESSAGLSGIGEISAERKAALDCVLDAVEHEYRVEVCSYMARNLWFSRDPGHPTFGIFLPSYPKGIGLKVNASRLNRSKNDQADFTTSHARVTVTLTLPL
jgi:hypothetical protein